MKGLRRACVVFLIIMALGTACSQVDSGLVNISRDKQMGDMLPAWSPDGSQIAFVSSPMETSDSGIRYESFSIYMMDADGRNRFEIMEAWGTALSWSPGGDEIVFSTSQAGIGIIDLDGNLLRFVIPQSWSYVGESDRPGYATDGTTVLLGTNWPSYSPDGTKILFGKCVQFQDPDSTGSTSYWQIHLVDINGANLTKLSPDRVNEYDPAWSPDGTKIVFTSDRDVVRGIYVMDVDGSNVVRLADGVYGAYCPVWSPDGEKIAFTSRHDGKSEIYVMSSDGSNVVRLTNNSIFETSLSWSPDGTRLAVCGMDSSGRFNIYLLKMG